MTWKAFDRRTPPNIAKLRLKYGELRLVVACTRLVCQEFFPSFFCQIILKNIGGVSGVME
jgi:hypothetical protein